MASPAAAAQAKASNAVSSAKQKASDAKSKLDAMKQQATAILQNVNINAALNITGQLASKLGGIQAASILADAVPGKILPTLAGAAAAAQVMNNVSKLLKKAKGVGNKKSGQAEDESAGAAQEQTDKKMEAIEKAREERIKKEEEKKKNAQSVTAVK